MRVALCLHGHFRTFDRCWENLRRNVIDIYQPDVFAMAWMDSMGTHLSPLDSKDPHQHPGFKIGDAVSTAYLRTVIDRINPIDMHLDHYHLHDERFGKMVEELSAFHHPWPHHRPRGTLSLNWIRHVNLEMRRKQEERQGWTYDRVICTRWDINHPIPIRLEMHDPALMTLTNVHGPDVTSDVWAAGPGYLMDAWADMIKPQPIQHLIERGTFSLGTHEWMKAWFMHRGINWQNRDDLGVYTLR